MTDLLDLLADLDPTPRLTHVVLPDMGFACGGDILTTRDHFTIGTTYWDRVTCPGCLNPGQDALAAECRRMQTNQADIK